MPLSAHDLGADQRYHTFVHVSGIQDEGKDFGARRHKSNTSWPELKSDSADKKVLSNWIVYDKPFYAMGAGTVVGGWRNAPENTPGSYHADYVAKKFASKAAVAALPVIVRVNSA